jgi:hypothetical protein
MNGLVKLFAHYPLLPIDICKLILQNYLNEYDLAMVSIALDKKLYLYTLLVDENKFAQYCAKHGYLKLLKWSMVPLQHHICEYAAKGGHLDMLKYLIAQKCELTPRVVAFAAAFGHLHIVKYFFSVKELKHYITHLTLRDMILHGNIRHLFWMCGVGIIHKFTWDTFCVVFAARINHLDILEFLLQQGFHVHVNETLYTAQNVQKVERLLALYGHV